MKANQLILLSVACANAAQGAPSASANYTVLPETLDSGGLRSASANYTHDGSAGLIAGLSTAANPQELARAGYIGQLYDVTGLAVTASPDWVNEMANRQLNASQVLDDATTLAVSASSIAWTVVTGPVSGISATGLATAGPVFEDTIATVQGSFGGLSGTFNLTVFNTLPDNYGSYAGDGINDAWQEEHFGLNNPDAGPLVDPDGDGQNNLFEFTAGIVPTDPNSRFDLRVEQVAGQPTHKRLVFSPRWEDRIYQVVTSTTLEAAGWAALTGGIVSDDGTERSVTDPAATEAKKFYRVEIAQP